MSDARLKCSTSSASIAHIFSFVAIEVWVLSCFCSVATGTRATESRAHIHTCNRINSKQTLADCFCLAAFCALLLARAVRGIAFERRTNEMPHIFTCTCVTYSNLVSTRRQDRRIVREDSAVTEFGLKFSDWSSGWSRDVQRNIWKSQSQSVHSARKQLSEIWGHAQ